MATDNANVSALRKAYRRWADTKGGSIDPWVDLCSENMQFRSLAEGAPGLEFTTARRTRSEVASYLTALVAEWEMLHYEVVTYVAEADRVVAIGHCSWRHRGTGKVVDTPKVDLWRFRDGRAVEFFELYDTARVLEGTR